MKGRLAAKYPPACRRFLKALLAAVFIIVFFGCGDNGKGLSPDEIIRDARLDLLSDRTYYLPANQDEGDETTYLPLRKWDVIFVGSMKQGVKTGSDPVALSLLIPGKYDHILVYVGKDSNGYAYAVELNTDEIRLEDWHAVAVGGLRFMCLGRDFGKDLQPSGEQVLKREFYGIRWARTFGDEDRMRLMAADKVLTDRVRGDILGGYPYQLEFRTSGSGFLIDKTIVLVDDGYQNGAGCADYWTNLFEDHAGLCMKGVRMTADRIMNYYLNDPDGKTAYLPASLNPIGTGDLPVGFAFDRGVRIIDDKPHRFKCDGSEEVGLVLPEAIFESQAMEDISRTAAFQ